MVAITCRREDGIEPRRRLFECPPRTNMRLRNRCVRLTLVGLSIWGFSEVAANSNVSFGDLHLWGNLSAAGRT